MDGKGNCLSSCLWKLNQGSTSRFAPRSGSRWDRDHCRHRRLDLLLAASREIIVGEPARVRRHEADRFGCVNRAATPHSDQAVTLCASVSLKTGKHIIFRRIRLNAAKHKRRVLERTHNTLDQSGFDQALVGYDKRPFDAQLRQLFAERSARAIPENNSIRKRENGNSLSARHSKEARLRLGG
jgi:hypothetical protein